MELEEYKNSFVRQRIFRIMKKEGCSKKDALEHLAKELGVATTVLEAPVLENEKIDWKSLYDNVVPELESKNHKFLAKIGRDYASIWISPTILGKSIADATASMRMVLLDAGIHDYDQQQQGTEHRVLVPCVLVGDRLIETKMSLYRPTTKTGDPRLWPYGLKGFCLPGDELALICLNKIAYILNLSKFDYEAIEAQENVASQGVAESGEELLTQPVVTKNLFALQTSSISEELLKKLRSLYGVPLRNPKQHVGKKNHDTDVGMAIEAALGVPPNSAKKPDYKGIELKAWRKRSGKGNRHVLFTQVPNWELCEVRGIKEFADAYGYPLRDKDKIQRMGGATPNVLHCTVQADKPNPQGLVLKVDNKRDCAIEQYVGSAKARDVLVWEGEKLRSALKEKHPETFWIECKSIIDSQGIECFMLIRAHYTRSPMLSRFLSLVESGCVTLDHMITYSQTKNSVKWAVKERGPAWKIHDQNFDQLFPTVVTYELKP